MPNTDIAQLTAAVSMVEKAIARLDQLRAIEQRIKLKRGRPRKMTASAEAILPILHAGYGHVFKVVPKPGKRPQRAA